MLAVVKIMMIAAVLPMITVMGILEKKRGPNCSYTVRHVYQIIDD
jgi:hypothetical protein